MNAETLSAAYGIVEFQLSTSRPIPYLPVVKLRAHFILWIFHLTRPRNSVITSSPAMSKISKHASFYIDTVTFRVEDCLFKVPREPFEKESTAFRDMFLLPTGDPHKEEGKSDDNPIHLGCIKKDEFEQLLSVLLYRTHGTSQKSLPENTQWVSILRLATLWGFDTIRQAAIDHLKVTSPPASRIAIGKTFDLDFESWSLPAMHEIVRRHDPINVEEAQHMGLDTTLKLASVRERVSFRARPRGWQHGYEPVPGPRPAVEELDFKQILRETFTPSSGLRSISFGDQYSFY
ncbi:hypothetical protein J3R83DRAFT_1497 [Lanmaoa asiatica]|nr:hypothetical protein J3R83DRAFT_1497 [Lanmaoa asiatica]